MARVCLVAMNSINPDLQFTVESQEDFPKERLPTLNFEIWMKDNKISHSYFQKPTKTPLVLKARTAMSFQQVMAILGNEGNRRLSNILKDKVRK